MPAYRKFSDSRKRDALAPKQSSAAPIEHRTLGTLGTLGGAGTQNRTIESSAFVAEREGRQGQSKGISSSPTVGDPPIVITKIYTSADWIMDDSRRTQSIAHPPPKPPKAPKVIDDVATLNERAAIIEFGADVPRAWAEGYAALCNTPPPPGFLTERWNRVVEAAGRFIDQWATRAVECGWSDLDIFGCHPARPGARFDYMGLALLLDRNEVIDIDVDGATLLCRAGGHQRYHRRALPADTVALWHLMVSA
jgi:hypothetical protein